MKRHVAIPVILFAVLLAVIAGLYLMIYLELSGIGLVPQDQITTTEHMTWFDDYYTVENIDASTIAIGEPRYYQKNYNYLLLGSERAILFDTGPGIRSIKPVVEALTSLPVTVISSHLHYDHIGGHRDFNDIALLEVRGETPSSFSPSHPQHLGFLEGITKPKLEISQWLSPGQEIDLGDRTITVLHTPGHTYESVMLLDAQRDQLFTGDFIYDADLYAFLPGSNIDEYLKSTKALIALTSSETALFAAHSGTTPATLPRLSQVDLNDLRMTLDAITRDEIKAEGLLIKYYPVNDRLGLLGF